MTFFVARGSTIDTRSIFVFLGLPYIGFAKEQTIFFSETMAIFCACLAAVMAPTWQHCSSEARRCARAYKVAIVCLAPSTSVLTFFACMLLRVGHWALARFCAYASVHLLKGFLNLDEKTNIDRRKH
jgi:hypothetical protein